MFFSSGELDDNLLPTGKEAVKSEDLIDDFEEFRKEEDIRKGPARPGTTKRRLYYFKRVTEIYFCESFLNCIGELL